MSAFEYGSSTVGAWFPSVLNPTPVTISFSLRESWDPVFSIALDSDFGSVFSAFLPRVGCPLVVSTFGASFESFGLFFNFELTVVTRFL